ncbi:hypothetical protein AB0B66_28425 [Catellatospora sp. NPDC049111]|uniref:hypothetical protein n=1 Tax=Catellatospora sp. NPDC049111 TaxID=3155271 RepID=UPI0033C10447
MAVFLGPYPLCPQCQATNGGLVSVRHRQIHLRAHGKEACVDQGLVGLLAGLWAVCDTRSCCEDDGGRAYVIPTSATRAAAVEMLTQLGLRPDVVGGIVWFDKDTALRLDEIDAVRRALAQPQGHQVHWRVRDGRFELVRPEDEAPVGDTDT